MGVNPLSCVAIEDSISGILSAKSAKMKCIAVPDIVNKDDKRLGIADVVLPSLEDISEDTVSNL